MTVREARQVAADYLAGRNLTTPREDAELILRSILQCDRTFLWAHPERELSAAEEKIFHQWLCRRGEHYPLQYLRGVQEFYGREFVVTPAVLIPRPESELLVEAALHYLHELPDERPAVLDVGTGSGCVAVTLACEDPHLAVSATDISAAALECARRNAERTGCLDRVEFLLGDALSPVADRPATYHLIVSNPPYVRTGDAEAERSVVEYEPREAVFAGESGLEIYAKLFGQGAAVLRPDGRLIVELGYGIGQGVCRLAAEHGWAPVELRKDLAGVERCGIFRLHQTS